MAIFKLVVRTLIMSLSISSLRGRECTFVLWYFQSQKYLNPFGSEQLMKKQGHGFSELLPLAVFRTQIIIFLTLLIPLAVIL